VVLQVPARREVEKSVGSLASINLQPRRLSVQVQLRAKRAVDEREGKALMVNLAVSQEADRHLRLSKGRGNPSAERKRARGLRRQGHDPGEFSKRLRNEKSGVALFNAFPVGRLCQTPHKIRD
jgi:hypothetical protein